MSREYIKGLGDILTPIADTQGIVKTTSYMVPDYTNGDVTNKFSTSTADSSWIVDKIGFVWLSVFKTSGTGYVQMYINGKAIEIVGMTGGTSGGLGTHALYPVKPGDKIEVKYSSGIAGSSTCRFIPPMFVTPPVPVVEYGTDYTLDEQPVLINDGTRIRQKKWLNGKPIYRRTYYGSVTYDQFITNGISIIHEVDFTSTKRLISENQVMYISNGYQIATQNSTRTTHRTDPTAFSTEPLFVSKVISFASGNLQTNIKGQGWGEGQNIEIYLTVEYWKTTD
jgi:hypothetical protein